MVYGVFRASCKHEKSVADVYGTAQNVWYVGLYPVQSYYYYKHSPPMLNFITNDSPCMISKLTYRERKLLLNLLQGLNVICTKLFTLPNEIDSLCSKRTQFYLSLWKTKVVMWLPWVPSRKAIDLADFFTFRDPSIICNSCMSNGNFLNVFSCSALLF